MRPSTRWSRSTSAGCPSGRRRRASTCGRSCSPPRSSSGVRPAQHVTFMVIASPAGAYFKGGVKPVTLWLTEEYTRAGRGGMGAAKTGGNYASSLVAQQEAIEHGCDQVVFLDAAEGKYVEELGGMNLYFVLRRRAHRHARDRHHPRGHHPLVDHRPRAEDRPPGRGAASSRSTSGATASPAADHRGLRLRHRRGRDAGRHPEVGRRRGRTAPPTTGPVTMRDPPGAGRHPVRPRRRHVRLDAPGLLSGRDYRRAGDEPAARPPPAERASARTACSRRIGEGGMGVVHLAQAPTGAGSRSRCCGPHVVGDDEARDRLAREVSSLRRVTSPRIAEIIDADPTGRSRTSSPATCRACR